MRDLAREKKGLGVRVRALRRSRQWTLDDLAHASGVSRAMLSKIERGETSPTLVVAANVAGAFEIGLSELIEPSRSRRRASVTPRAKRLRFDDPETGYPAVPRPLRAPRFNDYAHLARLKEWSLGGGPDPLA